MDRLRDRIDATILSVWLDNKAEVQRDLEGHEERDEAGYDWAVELAWEVLVESGVEEMRDTGLMKEEKWERVQDYVVGKMVRLMNLQ